MSNGFDELKKIKGGLPPGPKTPKPGGQGPGGRGPGGQGPGGPRRPAPKSSPVPTNAGHYYYFKGKTDKRDFGRRLDGFRLSDLLGASQSNLKKTVIHQIPYHEYFRVPDANCCFYLTTHYPGLLIGTGYMHPVPSPHDKNSAEPSDFQSGFYFDWTTGVPVIPGSTVKGVLRSVFPKAKDDPAIRAQKRDYLSQMAKEKGNASISDPKAFVSELERHLFDQKGCVFHDAYIHKAPPDDRPFAEDYITPHKSRFSDPIPLRFLKIAPDTVFCFQFWLTPFSHDGIELRPGHLKGVFTEILVDFGIGAKRNTGFGGLLEN